MRIGVVADTHAPRYRLPDSLLTAFRHVDLIIHAGDLCTLTVLEELQTVAPVLAVHGNQDREDVIRALPASLSLELAGRAFHVLHGHAARTALAAARIQGRRMGEGSCVIFGHSHRSYNECCGGVLLFNPGSPTWPRSSRQKTCGILTVTDRLFGELVELPG